MSRSTADITAEGAAPKKAAGKTGGKKTSPYNDYMKVTLAKIKADQEKAGKKPVHKDNFKTVAQMWATAPENPKNQTQK